MATNRDQLQAQQFLQQRVVSALVTGESDPEQPPFRRARGAGIGSIALAVVVLAAFGVYGVIVPGGSNAWRGEFVVVEKETGARHVYLDGRLHPVANYASALLVLNKHAETRTVSRRSLEGVPRGPRLGIPDAPDSLPAPADLLPGGWTACSQPGADRTGATVDDSVLLVGSTPAGGRPLGDRALLVRVADTGDQYLVWRGYRHRIRESDTVAVGLALRTAPWARVGAALVDVLPAGRGIEPITPPDLGAPSTAVPEQPLKVGQLLVAETSGDVQHYLVEKERLRPISPLQYDIQRSFEPTTRAYDGGQPVGIPLGLVAAGRAPQSPPAGTEPGQPPAERPEFASADESVLCASFGGVGSAPELLMDPDLPEPDPMTRTARRTAEGTPLADRVVVPPGRAAVVEVMSGPDAPVGTVSLVTDQGRAHPLAGREVLDVLGYRGVTPVKLPASLVARVPPGSVLDPAAALGRG